MAGNNINSFYSLKKQEAKLGVYFIAPVIIILGSVIVYPLIYTLTMGFLKNNLMDPSGISFIGLKNYIRLYNSSDFRVALVNTITLSGFAVVFQVIIGMLIALLFNDTVLPAKSLFRSMFILPWVIPTFVAAFAWVWMMDFNYGTVNHILVALKLIKEPVAWFGQGSTAMLIVIIAHIWKGLPFVFISFLAGLQTIDPQLLEAATVDGANIWEKFWYVTLPGIKDIFIITLLLRGIWNFNWFDFAYLLTGGGPGITTLTLPIQVYNEAFIGYRFGRASAIGSIMFLFLLIFTILYFKLTKGEEGGY